MRSLASLLSKEFEYKRSFGSTPTKYLNQKAITDTSAKGRAGTMIKVCQENIRKGCLQAAMACK
jgi:hypothetical protein